MAASLWIVFTLIASAAQTARNAMQRHLIETLGTAGATHVRFLFGFPFAVLFFALTASVKGTAAIEFSQAFIPWVLLGALAQIAATALMLMAMKERSFVVTTAIIKAEPIVVAVTAALLLSERPSLLVWAAIAIATIGVIIMSWKPGAGQQAGVRPIIFGLVAAGCFALSSVGYRGAVMALGNGDFWPRATFMLVVALGLQTLILSAFLLVKEPRILREIVRNWRPSLVAGFMGALASQFWFMAFALETPAKVRTLALIEILFAGIISGSIIKQATSRREGTGIALVVLGVVLLLQSS